MAMTEKQKQYFIQLCQERGLNPESVLDIFNSLDLPEWKVIDVLKRIEKNSNYIKERLNAEIVGILFNDKRLDAVKYVKVQDFLKILSTKDKRVLEELLPQMNSYQIEFQKNNPSHSLPNRNQRNQRRRFYRYRYWKPPTKAEIIISIILLFFIVSAVFQSKQEQSSNEKYITYDCSLCPTRCRNYSSCEFARFCTFQCGKHFLDGDGDGIPCEWGPCYSGISCSGGGGKKRGR